MEQGLTAKPYFPWVGGKEKLIPIICPIFPPGMPRYGEHFGGSGSILLGRPRVKGRIEIYGLGTLHRPVQAEQLPGQ